MPSLGYSASLTTGAASAGVTGVISVSYTSEVEAVDITHRGSATGVASAYRVATGGFQTNTIEIECLDATTVMTKLDEAGSGYAVTSVTENQPLDGPVTFTVTVREV